MYLVDTKVAIHLRDSDSKDILQRFAALGSPLQISLLSWVELEGGVDPDSAMAAKRRTATDALLRICTVLPFDDGTVRAYSGIVAACGFSRSKILDRLIAATAIVNDLTLITINGQDFRDIPGLRLEVWPPAQWRAWTAATGQRVIWNSTRVAE